MRGPAGTFARLREQSLRFRRGPQDQKKLTGMSRRHYSLGLVGRKEAEELLSGTQNDGESAPWTKVRSAVPGGGRKKIQFHFPRLTAALQKIIDVYSYGSPTKVLHWGSLESASEKNAEDSGR